MSSWGNSYESPRWSGEIIDCSMPMTFDTRSVCSYNCLYCFAFFQKSHTYGINNYIEKKVSQVNVEKIKRLFLGALSNNPEGVSKSLKDFFPYIQARKVMQWGGLADGFDDFERKNNISLQLLQFFDSIDYPLSISTKGTWWTKDIRYMSLLRKHNHNWHFKISIITSDPLKAAGVERKVDSPHERFLAIKRISSTGCAVTLRLRPYIIGISDDWKETITQARLSGADSVTTEFFCLESRADDRLKYRYKEISKFAGYDVWNFYRENSKGSGYRRLNYDLKTSIVKEMKQYTHELGMRFYVSDAHHKEESDSCCCCGVPKNWNVCKGHFSEALQIAKNRDSHLTYWSDIETECMNLIGHVNFSGAAGFNEGSNKEKSQRLHQTLGQYLHEKWNSPSKNNSPYTYFSGILYPVGLDDKGDVIYKYNKKKAN